MVTGPDRGPRRGPPHRAQPAREAQRAERRADPGARRGDRGGRGRRRRPRGRACAARAPMFSSGMDLERPARPLGATRAACAASARRSSTGGTCSRRCRSRRSARSTARPRRRVRAGAGLRLPHDGRGRRGRDHGGAGRACCPTSAAARGCPRSSALGNAKELIMTGKVIDGREAHRIGFANRIAPADELDEVHRGAARTSCSPARRRPSGSRSGCMDAAAKPALAATLEQEVAGAGARWRPPRTSPRARAPSSRSATRSSPGADAEHLGPGGPSELIGTPRPGRRTGPDAVIRARCVNRGGSGEPRTAEPAPTVFPFPRDTRNGGSKPQFSAAASSPLTDGRLSRLDALLDAAPVDPVRSVARQVVVGKAAVLDARGSTPWEGRAAAPAIGSVQPP